MDNSIIDRYKRYLSRSMSKNTCDSYISDIKKFMSHVNVSPIDVNFDMVEDYIYDMVRDGSCSKSSMNRYISSIKGFFEYLKNRGDIEKNPFNNQKHYSLKGSGGNKDYLTLDEFNIVLDKIRTREKGDRYFEFNSKRNELLLSLLFSTGLRIEEALNISFNDMEVVNNGIMVVCHNKDKSGNNQIKRVPICAITLDRYNSYMSVREKISGEYLFVSNNGAKFNKKDSNKMIKKYVNRANIDKNVTNHSFRYSFRTIASCYGNENLVCAIGGWSYSNMGNVYYKGNDPSLDYEKIKLCSQILG